MGRVGLSLPYRESGRSRDDMMEEERAREDGRSGLLLSWELLVPCESTRA